MPSPICEDRRFTFLRGRVSRALDEALETGRLNENLLLPSTPIPDQASLASQPLED